MSARTAARMFINDRSSATGRPTDPTSVVCRNAPDVLREPMQPQVPALW